MRRFRGWWCGLASAGLAAACVSANTAVRPVDFARAIWQLRIDVDSAPSRFPAKEPSFGSIDFAAHGYSIDLWHAINRKLPNGAYVAVLAEPRQYRIILGDSTSFDEKIVMIGRAVTLDSIVGTWTETIVCCSASGRFILWRPHESSAASR